MSIELVRPFTHYTFCYPLLLLSIFPSIRVFYNESVLPIGWPKYWSFSFSINPPNKCSGLISFRVEWFDLLAVQGTLKNLLQHHNLKASSLWHSAFFMVKCSHLYMTTGKTIALAIQTCVGIVMSLLLNTLSICHSFSSKEQESCNSMASVTICSGFRAQENKVYHCFHFFPHLFAMK